MKRTNRICIFLYGILCLVLMSALSLALYRDNMIEETPDGAVPQKAIQSNKKSEYQFVVVEESGNLVVYYLENKIKYLSTDIPTNRLPEDVQKQIKEGLNFVDEKSLYDFLENYSS
ncbi:MAG: hypothetical protein PUB19_02305 [Lachnospiraceae bacterium]|nr:hypothetical protein [Lachnospiraceae bacterium]